MHLNKEVVSVKRYIARITLFVLLIGLCSSLLAIPTAAEGEIFVAAGNTVLPLSDAMPIRSSGTWYIDYECFSEGSLKMNTSYNASEGKLVLYNWDTTLIFDIHNSTAYVVGDNAQYKATTVVANGTVYIPVQFTAQILDFEYDYYPDTPLIRVKRADDIPHTMFRYIAKNAVPGLLEEYNAKKVSQEKVDQPVTQQETKKQSLRLTFNIENGENFGKILSSLSTYGFKGTFFIDQTAIPRCENEIRRAIVQGHSIGILAENADNLTPANAKLFDVAKTKTRLVRFKGGSESLTDADVEKTISLGYRLWDSNIVPGGTSASSIASNAIRSLSSTSRSLVLALSDSDVNVSALTRILKHLSSKNYSSYIIHILDTPVNKISERR